MDQTESLYKYEVIHVNIRGARSNQKNLEQYLAELNYPEVVCLNETKLPRNKKFELSGYTITSRREHNDVGGSRGSMILTRSDIADVTEIEEVKEKFHEEIIGIFIHSTPKRPSLHVFSYYNPPLTVPSEAIFRYISTIKGACVLAGDLNCKNTVWGSSKSETRGVDLQNTLERLHLIPFNDHSKTRCDPVSGKEESLDIVVGNLDAAKIFCEFWVGFDIGSDHYPLHSIFQFKEPNTSSSSTFKTRRIQKLNMTKFNRLLREHGTISPSTTAANLDDNAALLTEQINDAFESSCPLTTIRKRQKCSFTPEIQAKVKEKRRLRREKNVANQMQNHLLVRELMTRINRLGNEIKKLQKLEQKRTLEKHCLSLNTENNSKKFFETFSKVANPILNKESTASLQRPIEDELGNRASTNQEKANLFANRLQKIHQEPDFECFDEGWKVSVERFLNQNKYVYTTQSNHTYEQEESGDDSNLCVNVSLDEFDSNLAKCKNRSAVGHDGISYLLLKKLPDVTKQNLCQVYSDGIRLGHFPKIWKFAVHFFFFKRQPFFNSA